LVAGNAGTVNNNIRHPTHTPALSTPTPA